MGNSFSKCIIDKTTWCLWLTLHLRLPTFYRIEYTATTSFPQYQLQDIRYFQSYVTLPDRWNTRAGRLHEHWIILRDISVVLVGVVAPYLGTTKAPSRSMTFILGSLCLFNSFVATVFSHIYVGNAKNIRKGVMVDYWLEASGRDRGLWFWTLVSLPAVWFTVSITSFFAFVLASVWEDTVNEIPHQLSTRYARLHRGMLCWGMVCMCVHLVMIAVTWLRLKKSTTN